jgi:hypothetical protein
VAETAPEAEVAARAVARAEALAGKPRQTLGAIKRTLHAGVLELLAPPPAGG